LRAARLRRSQLGQLVKTWTSEGHVTSIKKGKLYVISWKTAHEGHS
jgi:hypothetical protein